MEMVLEGSKPKSPPSRNWIRFVSNPSSHPTMPLLSIYPGTRIHEKVLTDALFISSSSRLSQMSINIWMNKLWYIYNDIISVCVLSCFWLFATLWTVAHLPPLSVGCPRQEYWSELPFPSPGDLPHPGSKLWSSALEVQCCNHWTTRKVPTTSFHIRDLSILGFWYLRGVLELICEYWRRL